MSFTPQEIDEFYNAFKKAYLALSSGVKSYTINVSGASRSVTRENLSDIKREMIYWQKQRQGKSPTRGISVIPFEPIDN